MEALAVEMTAWQCISTAKRGVTQGFPRKMAGGGQHNELLAVRQVGFLHLFLRFHSVSCIIRPCGEMDLFRQVALPAIFLQYRRLINYKMNAENNSVKDSMSMHQLTFYIVDCAMGTGKR